MCYSNKVDIVYTPILIQDYLITYGPAVTDTLGLTVLPRELAACEAGVSLRRPTLRGCRGGARKQRPTHVIVSAQPTALAKPVVDIPTLTFHRHFDSVTNSVNYDNIRVYQ